MNDDDFLVAIDYFLENRKDCNELIIYFVCFFYKSSKLDPYLIKTSLSTTKIYSRKLNQTNYIKKSISYSRSELTTDNVSYSKYKTNIREFSVSKFNGSTKTNHLTYKILRGSVSRKSR